MCDYGLGVLVCDGYYLGVWWWGVGYWFLDISFVVGLCKFYFFCDDCSYYYRLVLLKKDEECVLNIFVILNIVVYRYI